MSTTKAKTSSPTVEDAVAAVDDYLADVAGRIMRETVPGVTRIDVADLDDVLRVVCDAFKAGSADAGIEAVHQILAQHCTEAAMLLARGVGIGEPQAQHGVMRLAQSHAAFNAAMTVFDRQPDLDTAEGLLAAAERELSDRVADLEAAVEAGDVDAVLALRSVVGVELPGRIGDITATVLDLEAERAELLTAVPVMRRARIRGRAERIAADLAAGERAVAKAQAGARNLGLATAAADGAVHAAAVTRDQAQAAANAHRAGHSQAQRQRLRQLAGLPALDDQPATTAARLTTREQPDPVTDQPVDRLVLIGQR